MFTEKMFTKNYYVSGGLLRWQRGKEPAYQGKRYKQCKFDLWVGRIPWRKACQSTPSILAWKIPWTEEPGKLQSTGSHRVGHD